MGTWSAGPFQNDSALDFVATVVEPLEAEITGFVATPEIDNGFEEAFAAIALLNAIYGVCAAYRPEPETARAWRDALVTTFDERIDALSPKGDFKATQRASLVKETDAFVAACEEFHTHD